LIAFAVLFLLALYLYKNGLSWNGKEIFKRDAGLAHESALVEDLVKRDTDGDGVLDWEENLLGLDPTKTETTPGAPDITVVNSLRAEAGSVQQGGSSLNSADYEENLTETDKFAREFFSTVGALNQSGTMDQATVDKLSGSLAEHIKNSTPRKIFTLADIKVSSGDDFQSIQNYNDALNNVFGKYSLSYTAIDVFQKFIGDGNTINAGALTELDPIILQLNQKIDGLVKMEVPQSVALLHLDFINGLEKVAENLSDIRFFETDVIVALTGISQYETSINSLNLATQNLFNAISKKLSN